MVVSMLLVCGTPNRSGRRGDSFACSWDPFLPPGLPCPALMWELVSSPIESCYAAVFSWYPEEACSFLKRSGGGVD